MTDSREPKATARRRVAVREILDAAWELMAREGVAEVSVREVARSVGLRQQSLTYYFPTKHALLDALFADGFTDLGKVFDELPETDDTVQAVVDLAVAVVEYCVTHPARYHLMFQRTIPGFQPTDESHGVALGVLSGLMSRLDAAGITDPGDVALIRSLISGLAAEQTANDPGGRFFAEQTSRGIRALVTAALAQPARNATQASD
ncbi:MAG TPA: TetR/AcrR family transcriptional regulator [Nocardioidaceae bacterium]|nr:TetR/AcrR family transcriptional regulator [Nocardioidaceae bacterium]